MTLPFPPPFAPPPGPPLGHDGTPGMPQQDTMLDAQALANLAQLDPTGANRLVQRVMSTYRSSMARMLAQLALARVQADTATQRLVAHTLKSSSASVGALALSALCGEAEKALHDGQVVALPALLDQLVAEAVRVDAAVLQLLTDE